MNSKWVINLNVKAKTIKLTGKNGVNKDFTRQKKCPIKAKKKKKVTSALHEHS